LFADRYSQKHFYERRARPGAGLTPDSAQGLPERVQNATGMGVRL